MCRYICRVNVWHSHVQHDVPQCQMLALTHDLSHMWLPLVCSIDLRFTMRASHIVRAVLCRSLCCVSSNGVLCILYVPAVHVFTRSVSCRLPLLYDVTGFWRSWIHCEKTRNWCWGRVWRWRWSHAMWFPLWIRTDQDVCSRVAHVKSCVPTATTDVIHGLAIRTMTGVTVRMTLKINGLTITVIRWIGTLVSMIEADRHVCSTMLNVISCVRVRSTCTCTTMRNLYLEHR